MLGGTRNESTHLQGWEKIFVDDEDYVFLSRQSLYVINDTPTLIFFAQKGKSARISLAKLVIGEISPGLTIVYRDKNVRNLQRSNLLPISHQLLSKHGIENKYRGVSPNSSSSWRATISRGGKIRQLGVFEDEEAAARAWDRACYLEYMYKEILNFPEEIEE